MDYIKTIDFSKQIALHRVTGQDKRGSQDAAHATKGEVPGSRRPEAAVM
jgi:hypothetical protein